MARGSPGFDVSIPDFISPEAEGVGPVRVDTSGMSQVGQMLGRALGSVGAGLEEIQNTHDKLFVNSQATDFQSALTDRAIDFDRLPDDQKVAQWPQLKKDLTDLSQRALQGMSPQQQLMMAPIVREQTDRHLYVLGTQAAQAQNRAEDRAHASTAALGGDNMLKENQNGSITGSDDALIASNNEIAAIRNVTPDMIKENQGKNVLRVVEEYVANQQFDEAQAVLDRYRKEVPGLWPGMDGANEVKAEATIQRGKTAVSGLDAGTNLMNNPDWTPPAGPARPSPKTWPAPVPAPATEPTADARDFFQSRFTPDKDFHPHFEGTNPEFATRLQRAIEDAEQATGSRAVVTSMNRTYDEQVRNYNEYLRTGQGLAAPPGRSLHERGNAADIARGPVLDWLHQHAGEYGLSFLHGTAFTRDPVHIQMAPGPAPTAGRAPYDAATHASNFNMPFVPQLAQDRARFAQELKDHPDLYEKALRIAYNEQTDNPAGTQAVLESAMNRASVRGTTLEQALRWYGTEPGGYYERGNMGRGSESVRAMLGRSMANALAGSNITDFATDNSSGTKAAEERRGTEFGYRSGHNDESFFMRNAERRKWEDWVRRMGGDPAAQGAVPNLGGRAGGTTGQGGATIIRPDFTRGRGPAPTTVGQGTEAPPDPAQIRFNNPFGVQLGDTSRNFGGRQANAGEITAPGEQSQAVFPDAVTGAAAGFAHLNSPAFAGQTLQGGVLDRLAPDVADAIKQQSGISGSEIVSPEFLKSDSGIAFMKALAQQTSRDRQAYPLNDEQWQQAAREGIAGGRTVGSLGEIGITPKSGLEARKAAAEENAMRLYGNQPETLRYALEGINRQYQILKAQEVDTEASTRRQQQEITRRSDAQEVQFMEQHYQNNPEAMRMLSDPALTREAKERLLRYYDKPTDEHDLKTYGPAFWDTWNRVHAPENDPRRITSSDPILELAGKPDGLTLAGAKELMQELYKPKTPEGEAETQMKKIFLEGARRELSGEGIQPGMKDPKGEELFLQFVAHFNKAYQEGRDAGKAPADMLDPASKDYIGKEIETLKRPFPVWFNDMQQQIRQQMQQSGQPGAPQAGAAASQPAASTPQPSIWQRLFGGAPSPPPPSFNLDSVHSLADLQAAVRAGSVDRATALRLSTERGWIRENPPPIPSAPQSQ